MSHANYFCSILHLGQFFFPLFAVYLSRFCCQPFCHCCCYYLGILSLHPWPTLRFLFLLWKTFSSSFYSKLANEMERTGRMCVRGNDNADFLAKNKMGMNIFPLFTCIAYTRCYTYPNIWYACTSHSDVEDDHDCGDEVKAHLSVSPCIHTQTQMTLRQMPNACRIIRSGGRDEKRQQFHNWDLCECCIQTSRANWKIYMLLPNFRHSFFSGISWEEMVHTSSASMWLKFIYYKGFSVPFLPFFWSLLLVLRFNIFPFQKTLCALRWIFSLFHSLC